MMVRNNVIILAAFSLFLLSATACSRQTAVSQNRNVPQMAPLEEMPDFVQLAPQRVREAYQFSVASPEIAEAVPCYCGCVHMGHQSSYDCYVADVSAEGKVTYDEHALYCQVCIDITQDAMALMRRGRSIEEIKAFVDKEYAIYGPSTGH